MTAVVLSDRARNSLIESEHDCAMDGLRYLVNDEKTQLKEKCWDSVELNWSVGGGQGDCVVLSGGIDTRKFVLHEMTKTYLAMDMVGNLHWLDNITINVTKLHGYRSSNEVVVDHEEPDPFDSEEEQEAYHLVKASVKQLASDIEEAVKEYVKNEQRRIYRMLDEENDYHYTDDHLIEMAQACAVSHYWRISEWRKSSPPPYPPT